MPKGTASKLATDLFAEFASKVVSRLPRDLDPDVVKGYIDSPASLARALRRGLAPEGDSSSWPIWKTLLIGGVSKDELSTRLRNKGFQFSRWADNLMSKLTTARKPHTVSLVRVTPKDLGFTEMPTTPELFARAKEHGLDLCPAEVGPHLRLALADQQKGDYFWVAMEPIIDLHGNPSVFDLASDGGGCLLSAVNADPARRWVLAGGVVFLSSK